MPLIDCTLPATFWTHLTYACDTDLPEGARVLLPLGRSERVGLTVNRDNTCSIDEAKIKSVVKVIDDTSPIPKDLWELIKWFGNTWFLGTGLAAKTLLPSKFFSDEQLEKLTTPSNTASKYSCECIYETSSEKRYEYYESLIAKEEHILILFPENVLAKNFWKKLPKKLRDKGALWPVSQSAAWKMWKRSRTGEVKFIVGSPAAAFAPLSHLSCIVIDEENSGSWRTRKYPYFNIRSLLGKRAQLAEAKLVLGGSMPSPKCYINFSPSCKETKNEPNLVFVSSKDALSAEFNDIKGTLPISVPLIRETIKAREEKKWAFWILDRKGYASSISCCECGKTLTCDRCGSGMRWNEKTNLLVCKSCGQKSKVPLRCPNCGGKLLYGERPGLEALYKRTETSLKNKFGNVVLLQDNQDKKYTAESLGKQFHEGALLIGTRKIISFCDELNPAAVGWIDADAEITSDMYNAKAIGYWTLWESMWRGTKNGRKLVIQNKRFDDWQNKLKCGWNVFWQKELKMRRELQLPPFIPLIKITADSAAIEKIAKSFDAAEFDFWQVEENESELWVRSKHFSQIYEILRPYFSISSTQKDFPRVLLYLD